MNTHRLALRLAAALLWLPFALHAQYRIDKVMEAGRSALYFEDYVLAMQYFDRVISSKPNLYEPWYMKALAEYHLENYTGANADATKAISLNPYVDKIFELRAVARIRLGNFVGASADFTDARRINPVNRDYWYNRAFCSYKMALYTRAIAQLDTITRHWPTFGEAYSLGADVQLALGDTAKAVALLHKSLTTNPYSSATWTSLGRLALLQGHWLKADSALSEAIRLSPSQPAAYANRATARWHLGRMQAALRDYTMAIDIKPSMTEALHNRALLYRQMHNEASARADENALAAFPATPGSETRLGNLLIADADDRNTVNQSHIAASINRVKTEPGETVLPLASLHIVAGGQRIASAQPVPSADLYFGFAPQQLNREQSNSLLSTVDSLSAVISRTPRVADVLNQLLLRAVASADAQDYASAINDLQVCLSIDSTLTCAYTERAFCRLRQAAYEGTDLESNRMIAAVVEQDLLNAVAMAPSDALAYYNLAAFYTLRGDKERSHTCLLRAFELNPALKRELKTDN